MSVAYCYRSGEVQVARREPSGAIALVRGPAPLLRQVVSANARHSRTSNTLLVPGVPEAVTQEEALDAAAAWAKRVAQRPGLTYLGAI